MSSQKHIKSPKHYQLKDNFYGQPYILVPLLLTSTSAFTEFKSLYIRLKSLKKLLLNLERFAYFLLFIQSNFFLQNNAIVLLISFPLGACLLMQFI